MLKRAGLCVRQPAAIIGSKPEKREGAARMETEAECVGLNLGQAVPGRAASTAASVDVVDWEGCWDDPDIIETLEIV